MDLDIFASLFRLAYESHSRNLLHFTPVVVLGWFPLGCYLIKACSRGNVAGSTHISHIGYLPYWMVSTILAGIYHIGWWKEAKLIWVPM